MISLKCAHIIYLHATKHWNTVHKHDLHGLEFNQVEQMALF